jgi:hypothetical protein
MKPLSLLFVLGQEQQMRARRLGRLIGSLLAVAALAGGSYAYDLSGLRSAGFDWTGQFGGAVSVDAPATTVLHAEPTAVADGAV